MTVGVWRCSSQSVFLLSPSDTSTMIILPFIDPIKPWRLLESCCFFCCLGFSGTLKTKTAIKTVFTCPAAHEPQLRCHKWCLSCKAPPLPPEPIGLSFFDCTSFAIENTTWEICKPLQRIYLQLFPCDWLVRKPVCPGVCAAFSKTGVGLMMDADKILKDWWDLSWRSLSPPRGKSRLNMCFLTFSFSLFFTVRGEKKGERNDEQNCHISVHLFICILVWNIAINRWITLTGSTGARKIFQLK